ncbi:hypothetical protein [Limnoglobus roseus]|uniref:Uncharacterized protein n=1 Tax=Limnoglobus roseus TaxID=2598579 RepID=A0A5C1AJB9_9BACT|nr:hypothetical protein [Limnoglobus roseus]QEL19559.1 hypothetical protein PX52LOC_06635 [Limnoglobus roseus]
MFEVPVYKAEVDAGVADIVRASASLAHAAPVQGWNPGPAVRAARDLAVARLRSSQGLARAHLGDFDLHFLQTILATTGWNRNDDVFDPLEVWVARHTPSHKPFNYEHDCAHIIGHIISNWVMDDESQAVAEDTAADALPVKFHLATGGVLYKYWEKPELY